MGRLAVRRARCLIVVGILAGTGVTGCSANPSDEAITTSASGSVGTSVYGSIDVLAAASLEKPFITIGKQFRAAYPGTEVRFRFGSSQGLASEIVHGAHADVFAAASQADMDKVVAAQYSAQPTSFAKNASIAGLTASRNNPATVKAFIDYVLSPQGQAALAAAGLQER